MKKPMFFSKHTKHIRTDYEILRTYAILIIVRAVRWDLSKTQLVPGHNLTGYATFDFRIRSRKNAITHQNPVHLITDIT